MYEVHGLTWRAQMLANEIQTALDSSNYIAAKYILEEMVEQQQEVDIETTRNLISGATFAINAISDNYLLDGNQVLPGNNFPSTGNSLIHVALYARVREGIMDILLRLGHDYLAELHTNSLGFTPVEYANGCLPNNDEGIRELSNMVAAYRPNDANYYLCLSELVRTALHNVIADNNAITIDMADLMAREHAGRSMFNSSNSIGEHVENFIALSQCPNAIITYDGTRITLTDPNIRLLALVENELPQLEPLALVEEELQLLEHLVLVENDIH